jgi:hypothetical protein
MIHVLDKEDKAWNRRASVKLNNWIKDYKKTTPVSHPFKIAGSGKPTGSFYDRIARKD